MLTNIGYIYACHTSKYTPSSIMEHFGTEIQQLRKRAGLTQVEFAQRVGVGLRFIRDLEQGKPSVRLDKVNQVLKFLGHHLEIVSNHERRPPPPSQG